MQNTMIWDGAGSFWSTDSQNSHNLKYGPFPCQQKFNKTI